DGTAVGVEAVGAGREGHRLRVVVGLRLVVGIVRRLSDRLRIDTPGRRALFALALALTFGPSRGARRLGCQVRKGGGEGAGDRIACERVLTFALAGDLHAVWRAEGAAGRSGASAPRGCAGQPLDRGGRRG